MSWTKRQLIEQSFDEVGLASYVFDLSPEQMQAALRRLDAMMATWNRLGIKLGYPIPSSPENSDLDEESNIPDYAAEAVFLNLGLRNAPSIGKTVSSQTIKFAKETYNQLLLDASRPPEMQLPGTMPSGSGNKPHRVGSDPFLEQPNTAPIQLGENDQLIFTGD